MDHVQGFPRTWANLNLGIYQKTTSENPCIGRNCIFGEMLKSAQDRLRGSQHASRCIRRQKMRGVAGFSAHLERLNISQPSCGWVLVLKYTAPRVPPSFLPPPSSLLLVSQNVNQNVNRNVNRNVNEIVSKISIKMSIEMPMKMSMKMSIKSSIEMSMQMSMKMSAGNPILDTQRYFRWKLRWKQ